MKHKVEEITLIAKAPDMQRAFSKLAMDMFDLVVNITYIDLKLTKTIIMRSRDIKNLLFQFMKRLYELANNDLFVLATVKSLTIEQISNEYLLTAVLLGDKINPTYKVKDIVKQVTDRNIIIKEDRDGTLAQINLIVERRNK